MKIDPTDGSLSGEGRFFGASHISQNKLYFEVHVIDVGEIRIGVGNKLNENLMDSLAGKGIWSTEFGESGMHIVSGDVIGVAFDQSNFAHLVYYLNGNKLSVSIEGIKGSMLYPAISLKNGAKVRVAFDQGDFKQSIPDGFMHFVEEVSLI